MSARRVAVAATLIAAVAVGCSADGPEPTSSTVAPGGGGSLVVVPLEGRPSAVAYADGVLWVADDERGVVLRLDPTDGEPLGAPIAVSPHPTALAAGEGALWVVDPDGTVTELDTATATVHQPPLDVGGVLVSVAVDGPRVWVGDIEAGTVRSIEAETHAVGPALTIPEGVVRVEVAGRNLWITGREASITPVDLETSRVGQAVLVGMGPIGMDFAEGVLWVANSDDDTVSRIEADRGRRVGPDSAVGHAPVAVAVVDGGDVWVLDQDGPSLTRLDARNGSKSESRHLPTRPRGLAVTPGGVWVVGVDPPIAVLDRTR